MAFSLFWCRDLQGYQDSLLTFYTIFVILPPLLLESIMSIIIGMCITSILIIRIYGEEKMLIEELDGYIEYMQKVKYRLLPCIW